MRLTRLAAAPLLLACAAVPARGQSRPAETTYHLPGFDITLPSGFHAPIPQRDPETGLTRFLSDSPAGTVLVIEPTFTAVVPADAGTDGRRHVLDTLAVQASGLFAADAPGESIEREDRYAVRRPVAMRAPDGSGRYGLGDVTVARRGPTDAWLVLYVTRVLPDSTMTFIPRILDSFRLTGASVAVEPRDTSDVFRWVQGRWGWMKDGDPCGPESFELSVGSDHKTVRLVADSAHSKEDTTRVYVYDVLGSGADHIRGRIEGEKRTTPAGELVTWDFARVGRDVFCWRRGDWGQENCTGAIRRCTSATAVRTPPQTSDAADRSRRVEGVARESIGTR